MTYFYFTCLECDVLLQSFITISSIWRECVSGPLHPVTSLLISVSHFPSPYLFCWSFLRPIYQHPHFSLLKCSIELFMLMTKFIISWDAFGYCSTCLILFYDCFSHFIFLNVLIIFILVYFCSILGYFIISNSQNGNLLFIDSVQDYF